MHCDAYHKSVHTRNGFVAVTVAVVPCECTLAMEETIEMRKYQGV